MHVMIDLETLGVGPSARILQIGAVMFEPRSGGRILNGKMFNYYVETTPRFDEATVDTSTFAWWLRQGPEARARMVDGLAGELQAKCGTLVSGLVDFRDWPINAEGIGWDAIEGVWAKPATFDLTILTSAYDRAGWPPPWRHWTTRCARTMFDMIGGEPSIDTTGLVRHDAADDALVQAMQVQMALGSVVRA